MLAKSSSGLTGNILQTKVFEAYVIKYDQVLWYYKDGKRAMYRHPENKRNMKVVRESYVKSILVSGGMVGVRGVAWFLVSPNGDILLMSAATLTESVYEAHSREPNNPFVLNTIKPGLRHAVEFHPRTPVDVLHYLKRIHNEFHKGAATGIVELYQEVPELVLQWGAHMKEQNLAARSCSSKGENSYLNRRFNFINSVHEGKIKNKYQLGKIFGFVKNVVSVANGAVRGVTQQHVQLP